jgi:hypothetical protein
MDKIQGARHLLKNDWQWLEVANELDIELRELHKQIQKDKRLTCSVCDGIFEHIITRFRFCGFTCWASTKQGTWTELKKEYLLISPY